MKQGTGREGPASPGTTPGGPEERSSDLAVSVVVPTLNGARSMPALIEHLDAQTLDRARYEIVIVDNGSTDGTEDVVREIGRRSKLRLRCVRESAPGAAAARNRGIRETNAPIVAFTDDDVRPEPAWLEEILDAFSATPVAVVGGRTEAVWQASLPEWWLPTYEHVFARNWGDAPRPVTEFPFFYSLNLAARRSVLDAVGGFDERFGPRGRRHLVGEDADLCRRILAMGGVLQYAPRARVRHIVPAERLSRSFFRRRYADRGKTRLLHARAQGRSLALGQHARFLCRAVVRWTSARGPAERFHAELDVRAEVAYLAGILVRGGWS